MGSILSMKLVIGATLATLFFGSITYTYNENNRLEAKLLASEASTEVLVEELHKQLLSQKLRDSTDMKIYTLNNRRNSFYEKISSVSEEPIDIARANNFITRVQRQLTTSTKREAYMPRTSSSNSSTATSDNTKEGVDLIKN